MGCSLASSLVSLKKKLKKKYDPDVLFIEPSEAVVTQELRDVAAMGLRDIKYDVGPFITLVDGPDFDFLWQERNPLLVGQINDADLVAISRVDLIQSEQIEAIQNTLNEYRNPVFGLSLRQGIGLEEVITTLTNS